MDIKKFFRMPTPVKITGRTSSITNAFVNGIIPCITPTEEEIRKVLDILDMTDAPRCSYCGDTFTEWDHFRPLIQNKRPTGYISEIHNLVPACGKCNQSKGNSHWKYWILSDANLSPKTRNIENLDRIISRLENYEDWSNPTVVNFEEIVGQNVWEKHWDNCDKLHKMMQESQELSDKIKLAIANRIVKKSSIDEEIIIETKPECKEKKDRLVEKKEGEIAQTVLKKILESNEIPILEIQLLQTQEYSKKTFDINFPLLKKINFDKDIEHQKRDHKGRNRYYKSPILIYGKKYLLCSQWYDYNRQNLLKWIEMNN